MGRNKILLGSEVLIDLTADTVTPATLFKGITAHNAAGDPIVGEAEESQTITGTGTKLLAVKGEGVNFENKTVGVNGVTALSADPAFSFTYNTGTKTITVTLDFSGTSALLYGDNDLTEIYVTGGTDTEAIVTRKDSADEIALITATLTDIPTVTDAQCHVQIWRNNRVECRYEYQLEALGAAEALAILTEGGAL